MKDITQKISGRKTTAVMMANQGASAFFQEPSRFRNPFESEKQRKYLWKNKPSVAKKLSKHK